MTFVPYPSTPPSADVERKALETAMAECRRRLVHYREIHDDLNRDLAEADLNTMLERWGQLAQRPG